MTVIVAPFHLAEPVTDLPMPLGARTVTADLPAGDVWTRQVALDDAVADQVAAAARTGGPVTVLSGDCLFGTATLAGLQRAGHDPAVVWFDAHGDVHTLATSTSGYPGGLSLRLAIEPGPITALGLRPIAEDRAVLVGARDVDPAEQDYLAGAAVRRAGVTELTADLLPDGPLLLHVDVDVIDPADLPGLSFPVPGGPSAAEVTAAVARVVATGRVLAFDVACPWRHSDDQATREARAAVVGDLLAQYG